MESNDFHTRSRDAYARQYVELFKLYLCYSSGNVTNTHLNCNKRVGWNRKDLESLQTVLPQRCLIGHGDINLFHIKKFIL